MFAQRETTAEMSIQIDERRTGGRGEEGREG